MAKKFMFVCLGILALAFAYHLGVASAVSQGSGVVVGVAAASWSNGTRVYAITDNGDCYRRGPESDWHYFDNVFGAAQTQPTTWGAIKADYGESDK